MASRWYRFIVITILICNVGLTPIWAITYLDVEQMVRSKMGDELIQAQIEKENAFFTFEEIVYLKERKLSAALVDRLLRYNMISMPDIDVDLLIQMKETIGLSDEMIELLVNRYGVIELPLTSDDIIELKEAKVDDNLIEWLIRSEE